ncbi:MAG: MotA/TolQ/ExbB proton channel family protein [Deltaproteobacteria bacterium]|nr:MotA/TolQ/ExbB proton channel family protein [Deltaproteobacteria bacterium]
MAPWIVATQWASRLILILLFGLSVWSIRIMIERSRVFKGLSKLPAGLAEARKLIAGRDWKGLQKWVEASATDSEIFAGTLRAAVQTGSKNSEQIDRAVKSYLTTERTRLEAGLTVLATLGSNAPFIGLFGTVLGIIQAFGVLGNQTSNTAGVMTSISEALVATAVGLFVAIPAVVAYNTFTRRLRLVLTECESLRDFYISRIDG